MSETPHPLSVDAGTTGLLAHLGGVRPIAPAWFDRALAMAPERAMVTVAGAKIETLAWGRRGDRGLLLLHGNGAHAGWWEPLAPLFVADGYRVAAMSWSGMGGSDWRETYTAALFAQEVLAVCDATGLFAGPEKPILLAHSFGGFIAGHCAAHYGERFRAVITADSPVRPPDYAWDGPPSRTHSNRVYPVFEEALSRFRLAPSQPCDNLWYIDHIARGSIRPADGGFTWKFDPFVFRSLHFGETAPTLGGAKCPTAFLWGDRSILMPPDVVAYMRATAPAGSPFLATPEAAHHLMLDQPLPFVAAVRGLLAGWPR